MTDNIIIIRETKTYDEVIEKIHELIEKKDLSYIEILGVLETIKGDLITWFHKQE